MTIVIKGPLSDDDEEYYERLAAQFCDDCMADLIAKEMAKPIKED